MKFLDWLFGPSVEPEKVAPPQIGQQWVERAQNGDPWGDPESPVCTILDVCKGWVRYARGCNSIFSTHHRLPLELFVFTHHPYPSEPVKKEEAA